MNKFFDTYISEDNLLVMTDSYKVTHANAYASGIRNVYSYLESRGGEFDNIVFFGLNCFFSL